MVGVTCVPLPKSFEVVCTFLGSSGNWVSKKGGLMLLGKHSGGS